MLDYCLASVANYGNQNVTKNFPVVYDGYVKYAEAESIDQLSRKISEITRKNNN